MPDQRSNKELLVQSRQFASENRWVSWWHFYSTFACVCVLVLFAALGSNWIFSLSSSFLAGLVFVRVFILYHDFLHGAILRNSPIAKFVMHTFGMIVLSPANIWKYTHDDHHKNNCRSFGAELGTFPIMTTDDYATSSSSRQFGYRIVRNPLIILFGYFTSFFWNKCCRNFIMNPVKYYSAGVSVAIHVTLAIVLATYSWQALFLGMMLPLFIASAAGTYLFYAQHNFPGMKRSTGDEWDYVDAALRSSSYMKMSPLMHWFTGNIGYHHVHHLNSKIPFYRLPQAMNGIRELQNPTTTSLKFGDIRSCLKLKLWDPALEKMITFHEAKLLSSSPAS